jgi:hypothetical protein
MAAGAPKGAIKAGNALAYPLVASIYAHINLAGQGKSDTVLGHLNLTAFKYDIIKAMLPSPDPQTRVRLAWIEARINLLVQAYEPAIDLYPYAYARRAQIMQYVWDILADELALINDKKIVSSGAMATMESGILNQDMMAKVITTTD